MLIYGISIVMGNIVAMVGFLYVTPISLAISVHLFVIGHDAFIGQAYYYLRIHFCNSCNAI